MRAFIGIHLGETLRKEIICIIKQLLPSDIEGRWVSQENLHLTLKFLGNVETQKMPLIKKVVKKIAEENKKIPIKLKKLDFLPHKKRPRILYLATDNETSLSNIYSQLEELLQNLGFKKEGRFLSHITLLRMKSKRNLPQLLTKIKSIELPSTPYLFDNITIFESKLTPQGAIYEIIESFPLQ